MLACMIASHVELAVGDIAEAGGEGFNRDFPGFDIQAKFGDAYLHGAGPAGPLDSRLDPQPTPTNL